MRSMKLSPLIVNNDPHADLKLKLSILGITLKPVPKLSPKTNRKGMKNPFANREKKNYDLFERKKTAPLIYRETLPIK